jgi:2,3-bisphosphoglycerate-dependent phosphoglycerate mutase
LDIVLGVLEQKTIPITKHEALNERMYGDLQGLNKADTVEKFGEQQVKIWRRSFDIPPPGGESLKDTAERVIPYYEQEIWPELAKGKQILVVAHGNSLRALVMHLNKLTTDQVLELNIPTGAPLHFQLHQDGTVADHHYL